MEIIHGPSVSLHWEVVPMAHRRRVLNYHRHYRCHCRYRFPHRRRVAAGSHAELFA